MLLTLAVLGSPPAGATDAPWLLAQAPVAALPSDEAPVALPPAENWALHGQFTNVTQGHRRFTSPYSGANSLVADGPTEETSDLTLYAGLRVWRGAELWLNPEVDQGFGLSDTVGAAGFPSGEAYKIGSNAPYLRLQRVFLRQVIGGSGDTPPEAVAPAANLLGGANAADNVTLTLGKFSVVDIFDTNSYAHDPRGDFLNWSIIESGAFDYAADPWGYTYGAAAEWTQGTWTLRGGVFELSPVPNAKITRIDFRKYMLVAELEQRHEWLGHPGKIKLLVFANRAPMATYADALQLANATGATPDPALVRHLDWRAGVVVNFEQELASDLGAFVRYSANDGAKETYEFTDINASLAIGAALKGDRWGRHDDTVGVAGVINRVSGAARDYLAAGGLGILVGDGRLDDGPERIVEGYYSAGLSSGVSLALDWQYIDHPAYNRDRGPVAVWGVRLHAQF